jgi:hypothetical protein
MVNKYKILHIRKALDAFEQNSPERQTISLVELEILTKKFRTPLIYNIDELIRLLTKHIEENRLLPIDFYCESEVCKILNIKKLAMHHWRKKGYITCIKVNNRTIRYNLNILLADLKKIYAKTYQ